MLAKRPICNLLITVVCINLEDRLNQKLYSNNPTFKNEEEMIVGIKIIISFIKN
jgi:hypothetical protein